MMTEQIFKIPSLGGISVAAVVHGSQDAATTAGVLMIHGWLDNASTFKHISQAISDSLDGLPVVCLDLPGHGRSSHLAAGTLYYPWVFLAAIVDILDELRWDKAKIVGHSMSGHITLLFASTYPDRVDSIVVIESIGYIDRMKGEDSITMREGLERWRRAESDSGAKTMFKTFDDAVVARATKGATPMSVDAARTLCERGVVAVDGDGDVDATSSYTWASDKRLLVRYFFRWDDRSVVRMLGDVACRVLIIIGSKSTLLGAGCEARHIGGLFDQRIELLRTRAASLEVVEIDGGNHHLHLEAETRADVAEHINRFFLNKIT